MAHDGASRHHRWSRMRRRNHSEECNEENGVRNHQGRGLPVSGVPHRIFVSEPESADDDPDLSIRKRQQTGSQQTGAQQSEAQQTGSQRTGAQQPESQTGPHRTRDQQSEAQQTGSQQTDAQQPESQTGPQNTKDQQTDVQTGASQAPTTTAMSTVDATDTPTPPTGSPTSEISGTALSQTTDAVPSATSTDSSLLSLSIHSPDLSLATSLTNTPLTTDTPSLPSSLTPTIPATSTAAQSSLISATSTPNTATAVSSASLISRPSSTPTPSTGPSSTGISTSTSSTETSSTTSSTDTSTIFNNSDPTGFFGGVGGAGGSGTATAGSTAGPSATDSQPPQDSGPSPTTNKIVGGVVGSVAGIAFLFLVILLYLRRRHAAMRETRRGLPSGDAGGAAGEGSAAQSAEMVSRRSSNDPLFSAAYFAPAFVKHWRKSNQTTNTDSTLVSNPSDRGFQKISGRKIPSVLQAGGDGYGGGFGEAPPPGTEMSVDFQSPSPANIRNPPSQPPTANRRGRPLDVNYTRESGEPHAGVVVRPSPARTPAASSTNIPSIRTPSPPRSTPEPQSCSSSPPGPRRPDILGRSHPSFDGSRSSRFTEGL